jgi:hypothetical protein
MKRITYLLPVLAISFAILQGCKGTAIVAGDDTATNSAPYMTGGSAAGTTNASAATQSTEPAGEVNQIKTNTATGVNKATIAQ